MGGLERLDSFTRCLVVCSSGGQVIERLMEFDAEGSSHGYCLEDKQYKKQDLNPLLTYRWPLIGWHTQNKTQPQYLVACTRDDVHQLISDKCLRAASRCSTPTSA